MADPKKVKTRVHAPEVQGQNPGDTTNTEKSVPSRDTFHYTHSRQRLTEEKLMRMGKAEIRAVALDRGYEMNGLGGRTGVVREFLKCQENDEGLHTPGDLVDDAGEPVENLPAVTEFPSIDPKRTDDDLRSQFALEAANVGYGPEDSSKIAEGRLADLRAGGSGYTVRELADSNPVRDPSTHVGSPVPAAPKPTPRPSPNAGTSTTKSPSKSTEQ